MAVSETYPEPAILHDCEDLQLLHFATASDFSLIIFDIMHARANGRTAFALRLARRLGLDFYALVPKRPHWYPTRATRRVARLIGARKDRPSIGYGASMGGYGVLKHGASLRTDATLAFSPQATINPARTGEGDRRYGRYFDARANSSMDVAAADLGPNSVAICDPVFAPDQFQRSLLPPGISFVDLPFVGHRSATAMVPSANAMDNFEDALAGRIGALRARLVRASRDTLSFATGQAKEALKQRDWAAADDVTEAAIARFGEDRDILVLRARARAGLGDPGFGIADLRDILSRQPGLASVRRVLADCLEAAGDRAGAAQELARVVDETGNANLAKRLARMQADPAKDPEPQP